MRIGGRLKTAWSIIAGTYQTPDEWMWEAFGARKTVSGVSISETSAMNLGAVYACVSKISKTVGSLPFAAYRKTKDGKEKAENHPVYALLHDTPNPEMTAMVFRETIQAHVLQWGNGYAEIQRNGAGRPTALWPIQPSRVTPMRAPGGGLFYKVVDDKGQGHHIDPANMLHVPGLGFDGVTGYSVVRMARESMGLTAAAEQFGAAFFGNGASFGGMIEHPGNPTPDQVKILRDSMMDTHGGAERAGKMGIMTGGMKYSPTSIPPNDAQFLETRKFQVVEICRWFDMPPHKIASMDAATFSNIEHQSIEWAVDTIRPICVRWEQECNRKLFNESERRSLFTKHSIDGLMRGDYKSRMEGYSIGRNGGWLSANDILELEDRNRIPSGDIYLVPMNMQTAEQAANPVEKKPAPVAPGPAAIAVAEFLARKEGKAVESAIKRHGDDADGLSEWFEDFFGRHASNVSAALGVDAGQYTARLRVRISCGDGLNQTADQWASDSVTTMLEMRT